MPSRNDEGQFGYMRQKPGPHLGPSWSLGLPELSVCVTDIIIPREDDGDVVMPIFESS